MSFSRPSPAAPPPPPAIEDTAAAQQDYEDQLRKRKGRAASILTERTPTGQLQQPSAAKALLGG